MPALTGASVTAALPVAPRSASGPAAVNVHAVGTAVPPLSLVTVFTNVSCAGWSLLLIVHVADCAERQRDRRPVCVPPVHDHAPAV